MAEHRLEFHRELEGIEAKVIELFAMVAEDLPAATQAVLTGDSVHLAPDRGDYAARKRYSVSMIQSPILIAGDLWWRCRLRHADPLVLCAAGAVLGMAGW